MGKVFSPEQLAAGRIPRMGAQEEAGRFVLEKLFGQVAQDSEDSGQVARGRNGVQSALVYGSTVYGTAEQRSDVDVLVNYCPDRSADALPFLRSVFQSAEDKFKVAMEPYVLPGGALADPLAHSIDPLFARCLLATQEERPQWSYNRPAEPLRPHCQALDDPEALHKTAIRYTSGKARQFTRAQVAYRGQADLHVFQRALEIPVSIGRKVLAATGSFTGKQIDLQYKHNVYLDTADCFKRHTSPRHRAVAAYHDLYAFDHLYAGILDEAIDGFLTIGRYTEWLEQNYLAACQMALEVTQAWTDILKTQSNNA